jgi:predicted acylesterase/phospholipase RssA
LLSGEKGQYRRRLEQFFSGDRIGRLLGITFPTGHVFKHGAAVKLAGEICGDGRLEMFRELPAVMLCRGGESARRIFTTGYLRDMVAASFCLYPLFEDVAVQGEGYHSGYPDARVRVEDLFRTDIDETVHVSVSNAGRMNYRGGTIIDFFTRYLELAGTRSTLDESVMADTRFVLEVSEREVRVAKILDQSRELAESMMKKAGW